MRLLALMSVKLFLRAHLVASRLIWRDFWGVLILSEFIAISVLETDAEIKMKSIWWRTV